MKIDKLYTLSQFVDLISQREDKSENHGKDLSDILRYNEFLKQPLKKEMFVNEIEKPVLLDRATKPVFDIFKKRLKAWQEAEKKVIFVFESWISHNYSIDGLFYDRNKKEIVIRNIILKDLAEKTNGQLRMKNVEI